MDGYISVIFHHFCKGEQLSGLWRIKPFNPIALKKAKIVYNFGLTECNRVKRGVHFQRKEFASTFIYKENLLRVNPH